MIAEQFSYKPSGGSVTILSDFCNKPNGKLGSLYVVSHNLKSL